MPSEFDALESLIREPRQILVLTHEKPDGDAIGSSVAMVELIEKLGSSAWLGLVGPCPEPYRALVDGVTVLDLNLLQVPEQTDGALILDTGTWNQLGIAGTWLRQSTVPRVVIDHHRTQDDLGGPAILDTQAEATAILVHRAFGHFHQAPSRHAANALFTALAFDTGWFRHPTTKPRTFAIAGELMTQGAEPAQIFRQLHQQETLAKMHLRGRALNSLRIIEEGKIGVMKLGIADFRSASCTLADSEGLSDLPRNVAGVQVAITLLEEAPGKVRISLRGTGNTDVGKAAESLGGGGHRGAAGCRFEGSLDEAEARVLAAIRPYLGE